jgi:hypothetical protein
MIGNWDEVIQAFEEIYQRSISETSDDVGRQEVNRQYAQHAHGILNLIPRLRNYPDLRNVTVGTSHYSLFIEVPNTKKWLFVWCELPGPQYKISFYANNPPDPDGKVIVGDDTIGETILRLIKEFQEQFAAPG